MLVGSLSFTSAEAALKKPGNCRFVGWWNPSFTSCVIQWNAVLGAEGYEVRVSYTDGSHASYYETNNTGGRIPDLAYNHVYQAQSRAYITNRNGKRSYGAWSNLVFITPFPRNVKVSSPAKSISPKLNVKWNTIYGSSGYNVFMTTNPKGTWYWNQSTSKKATATTATITKYRGSKLKKYTTYYIRVVTRRKRNGVFCTVPAPSNSYYQAAGQIITQYK